MATCPTCRTHYPDGTPTCATDGEALLDDVAFASADRELAAGEMVGEYQIEHKLGEGGFGAVYRATHPLIGKTAAVKVLGRQFSSNPQMVSRFIAEARAVNQIRHKNIIDIFSFGALADGRQYYVMELLDGTPFDAHIAARGRLSVEEAVPILRGIARAIDAAHAKGIAHRDLKPENVFLVQDEQVLRPKLLDFGIAKLMKEAGSGHRTKTGTPMGTPYYMSPEQCFGRDVDHRTDIYAFGVMTFEALTGSVPFSGETTIEILMKHMNEPTPVPSQRSPGLSPALDAPVMAMMAKDQAARPATLCAAVEALAEAAGMPVLSVPQPSLRDGTPAPGQSGPALPTTPEGAAFRVTPPTGATTALDPGGQTFLAAELDPTAPAKPRRTGLVLALAAVGLLVLAGGTGAVMRMRTSAGVDPNAKPLTTAPLSPTTAVTPSAAASTKVAEPARPTKVTVTFTGAPPKAEIYQDANSLGAAAAPITVAYGAAPIELTVKAVGYKQTSVAVVPDKDATVPVHLEKLGAGAAQHGSPTPTGTATQGAGIHKDLEKF